MFQLQFDYAQYMAKRCTNFRIILCVLTSPLFISNLHQKQNRKAVSYKTINKCNWLLVIISTSIQKKKKKNNHPKTKIDGIVNIYEKCRKWYKTKRKIVFDILMYHEMLYLDLSKSKTLKHSNMNCNNFQLAKTGSS